MKDRQQSTLEKALEFNLNPERYGTFAEIGAGQEVVRWFFQAGGSAGTISKSISAYDMQVSDAIYGNCQRYVCKERLVAMLDYEQSLNRERLSATRGQSTSFFAFADTVSARNYKGTNECHAWMGIRFQLMPNAEDSEIILHARMLDDDNASQQEVLGIVGVNLVYAAYQLHYKPKELLSSLIDGISTKRIEIDMVKVSGPAFAAVDNRVMTLRLVQLGLTGAAMFAANGEVLQPSEALRKRPVLVERGRFRPVTHVNIDMLDAALRQFGRLCGDDDGRILPIMEISMQDLAEHGEVCLDDFVARAEVLATTGYTVMISDFQEYYRLAAYLFRCTNGPIGLAMGLGALRGLFEEKYYAGLDGGILESFGRLFKEQLTLLIYPLKNNRTGQVEGLKDLTFGGSLQHLFNYLNHRKCIVPLNDICEQFLDIHSPEVLRKIAAGESGWSEMVPESVAMAIKERKLFGYAGTG